MWDSSTTTAVRVPPRNASSTESLLARSIRGSSRKAPVDAPRFAMKTIPGACSTLKTKPFE
ncbi:MAG: hypothetical protein ACO2OZ_07455 [Acidilobaceae archaeon]